MAAGVPITVPLTSGFIPNQSPRMIGGTPPPCFLKTTVAESRQKGPNWRTGAPGGNTNAVKSGRYTNEMKALRAEVRVLVARTTALAKMGWCLAIEHDMVAKDERASAETRVFVQQITRSARRTRRECGKMAKTTALPI